MPVQDDFLPRDDLSEAIYTSVKLDAIQARNTRSSEDMEVDEPGEESTTLTDKNAGLEINNTIGINKETENNRQTQEDSQSLVSYNHTLNTIKPSSHAPWTLRKVLAGAHQGWVRSVAVDPVTNGWFATGLADAQIKVWDLATGGVKATIAGHIMGVRALAVLARHPYLFSGGEDKTLRCWDLERTHALAGCQVRDYHGHVGGVYAVALHPELDLLFSAGRDSAIRVWDMRSRAQVMVLTGHRNDVTSLATQTGDPQVCSASMDATLKLWDLRMQRAQVTLTHHAKSVRLMQMHPHELTLVSADSGGSINQWLLPQGRLLAAFGEGQGQGEGKSHVDKSRDANIINTLLINRATNEMFAGYADGRMQFFNYESGHLLQETVTQPCPGTPSPMIYASAFDMLGLRLITCENDKSIKIWANE